MWTRGRFNKSIVPGYSAIMIDTYKNKRAESMWPELVTQKTSKRAYEEDFERSGVGLLVEKGEGAPITFDTQLQGASRKWIHKVYALAIRISEEAIEDNLYELNNGQDKLAPLAYDLGEAGAENEESLIARFFNYGTATTYHKTRNGYALFYASHPRLDGTTFSNTTSAYADLTYTAFWAAVVAAENQYNHRQYKVKKRIKNLWFPPQLERQATEVLKSTDRPDTANRAINAMARSGRTIKLKNWTHMTDTDSWILQLEGEGIRRYNRRKTRFARDKDFQTGDMMIKVDQRWSAEIADEKCFYGVVPA